MAVTKTTKIIPIILLSAILIGVAFTFESIQYIKPANAQTTGETLFGSTFGCSPGACPTDGEIHRIDLTSGAVTKIIPAPAAPPGSGLKLPEDGAVSPTTGQVYFVEACFRLCDVPMTITGRIVLFNADGTGRTTVLSSTTLQPEGLSFDAAGNLFFNTRSGLDGRVYQIAGGIPGNPPVPVTPVFTTFGEGSLITSKGNLLAVDRDSVGSVAGRVVDFGSSFPTTGSGTTIITGLTDAIGIAEDSAGLIYVVEESIGKIFKYNPDGTGKTLFATGLSDPVFIEFDSKDNLYVAENAAGRVTKIAPDGTKTTIATIANVGGVAIAPLSLAESGGDTGTVCNSTLGQGALIGTMAMPIVVDGDVTIPENASCVIDWAIIHGNVQGEKTPGTVSVRNSIIDDSVQLIGARGNVDISRNEISSNIIVEEQTGGSITVFRNVMPGSDIQVMKNDVDWIRVNRNSLSSGDIQVEENITNEVFGRNSDIGLRVNNNGAQVQNDPDLENPQNILVKKNTVNKGSLDVLNNEVDANIQVEGNVGKLKVRVEDNSFFSDPTEKPGDLKVSENDSEGNIEVIDNGGSNPQHIQVEKNTADVDENLDGGVEVTGNTAEEKIQCKENTPEPISASGNEAPPTDTAGLEGQCA